MESPIKWFESGLIRSQKPTGRLHESPTLHPMPCSSLIGFNSIDGPPQVGFVWENLSWQKKKYKKKKGGNENIEIYMRNSKTYISPINRVGLFGYIDRSKVESHISNVINCKKFYFTILFEVRRICTRKLSI